MPEGTLQIITVLLITVVFLIPCFYALKLEVSIGAYKCKRCGKVINTIDRFLARSENDGE